MPSRISDDPALLLGETIITKQKILANERTSLKINTLGNGKINTNSKTTTTSARGNTSRFTCFSSLPPEIRLQIWRETCFLPRFIDLWSVFQGKLSIGRNTHQCCRYESSCPNPAVMQVNRESRDVGLKYYETAFGTAHELQYGFWVRCEARIWINWRVDWVVPMEERKWTEEMVDGFFLRNEKVQRVAVAIGDVGEGLLFHDLSRLPLKEVVLYREEAGEMNKLQLEKRRCSRIGMREGCEISFEGVEVGKAGSPARHWSDQLLEARRSVEDRYEEYIEDEEKRELVPVRPVIRCMKMAVTGSGRT